MILALVNGFLYSKSYLWKHDELKSFWQLREILTFHSASLRAGFSLTKATFACT